MCDVIDQPVLAYEPTAVLVLDESGSPFVSLQAYYDDPEALDARDPDVIRILLEPLDAKLLALRLLRVGQDGIEEEIRMERNRNRKEGKPC